MGRQLARARAPRDRVLIYGLGGGRGHAARALGLADGFRSLGLSPLVILPKRFAPGGLNRNTVDTCNTVDTYNAVDTCNARNTCDDEVPPNTETFFVDRPTSSAALWRVVERLIERWQPGTFIVDTFPRGVLGELNLGALVELVPRRILLTRYVRPPFQTLLREVSDAAYYECIVDLESHLGWLDRLPQKIAFGPIVGSNSDTPDAANISNEPDVDVGAVGAANVETVDNVDVLMVSSMSDPVLDQFLRRLAERLRRAGLSTTCIIPDQPMSSERANPLAHSHSHSHSHAASLVQSTSFRYASIQRAHVVVGAAGYNLTYECARAGTWHVSVPRPRRLDDQHLRARAMAITSSSPRTLEDNVRALIERGVRRTRHLTVHSCTALAQHLLDA